MNVSLTPHFDELIAQKIQSGQYHSASEVVREALRLLEERDASNRARNEYFKTAIQKGIDSGTSTEWNAENFLEKARKRAGLDTKD